MLGLMAKGFFSQSPVLFFPVLALIVFFLVFTLISFRALRTSKEDLKEVAALPLADDLAPLASGSDKRN